MRAPLALCVVVFAAPGCLAPVDARLEAVAFWGSELRSGGAIDGVELFEIVPPALQPQPSRGTVSVVLGLPAGGRLSVADEPTGASLVLPAGSLFARVERRAHADGSAPVADVRGVQVEADGDRFFVARPAWAGGADRLEGLRWPRDEEVAERAAHDELAARMQREPFGFVVRPRDGARARAGFRARGRCAACHERGRLDRDVERHTPPVRRDAFLPNRATDVDGYFSLLALFRDEQPHEGYGATDRADLASETTRFDLQRGLREASRHALAVCESRRRVVSLLHDDDAQLAPSLLGPCPPHAPEMAP